MPLLSKTSTFEEILEKDGELSFTSKGFSMYPLIHQNEDIIRIVKLSKTLKRGDIVLYKDKDHHYVLHRIIKIKRDGRIVLAGDHNYWKDPIIDSSCVLGILKEITRLDGTLVDLEKDYKFKGWLYAHFFYVKAIYQRNKAILGKIFKKAK